MVTKGAPQTPVEMRVVEMLTTFSEVVEDALLNPGVNTISNATRIDWAIDQLVAEVRREAAPKSEPWAWAYRRKATTDHPPTAWHLVFDDRDLHYPHLEVVVLYSGV